MRIGVTLSVFFLVAGMFLAPSVAHAAGPCTISTFSANNWVFSVQGVFTQTIENDGFFTIEMDYNDVGVITPYGTTGSFTFRDTREPREPIFATTALRKDHRKSRLHGVYLGLFKRGYGGGQLQWTL
jgi:hypothetical protein